MEGKGQTKQISPNKHATIFYPFSERVVNFVANANYAKRRYVIMPSVITSFSLHTCGNNSLLSCQYIHTLILIRNVAPEFVSDSCQSGTTNGILYLYIMHVDQLQMRSKLKEVTAAANNRNAGTAVPHKNGLLQKHLWGWMSFFQHV